MKASDELTTIIECIHDAALEPEIWPRAIEQLASYLNGSGGSLTVQGREPSNYWGTMVGSQIGMVENFNAHWAAVNPVRPAAFAAAAGTVLTERSAVGRAAFERSEFFNDFLRPFGHYASAAVKVLSEPDAAGVMAVVRTRRQGEFSRSELAVLKQVAPHLCRAVQVNQRLARLSTERSDLADALDRLSQGTMLVDGEARVLFANRAAQDILTARDGLHDGPGGLRADSLDQTNALRRLIRAAAAIGIESLDGTLAIRRPTMRRPLSVVVTPVKRRLAWLVRTAPAAIVFVTDPERAPIIPADRLRQLYGLTRAEANVALAALHGEGLQAIADGLGVSLTTARTHLQHVFEKTGTRRQAELVQVLLRSVPNVTST